MRRENVNRVLASLPRREREVIELRFGLKDGHPKTLEEVAKAYGDAHRIDPELYRFTRSLESIDKLVTGNTSLILRTDSEPFSLLRSKAKP